MYFGKVGFCGILCRYRLVIGRGIFRLTYLIVVLIVFIEYILESSFLFFKITEIIFKFSVNIGKLLIKYV